MSLEHAWPQEDEIRVLAYRIHRDPSMRGRIRLYREPEPLTKIHVLLAESSLFLHKLFARYLGALGRPYFHLGPSSPPSREFLGAWSSAAWEVDYGVRMEIKESVRVLADAGLRPDLLDWFLAENTLLLRRLSRPHEHGIHEHELLLVPTLTAEQVNVLQDEEIVGLGDLADHDEHALGLLLAGRGHPVDVALTRSLAARLVGYTPGLEAWGIGFRGPSAHGPGAPPLSPPEPGTTVRPLEQPAVSERVEAVTTWRDELCYRQQNLTPEPIAESARFCSFESMVNPGWFIRHSHSTAVVQRVYHPIDRVDATLRTPAVGDFLSPTLSASNLRDRCVRHRDGRVWLDPISYGQDFLAVDYDRLSEPLAGDCRFYRVPGLDDPTDPTLVSFRSSNFPDRYICSRRDNLDSSRFPLVIQSPSSVEAATDPIAFERRATFRRREPFITPCALQVWSLDYYVDNPSYEPYFWCIDHGVIKLTRRRWGADLALFERTVWNDPECLFIIRPGFRDARAGGVSFESFSHPGHFVRHRHSRLELAAQSDDELFLQDASFLFQPTEAHWSTKVYHFNDAGQVQGWHMERRTAPSVRLQSVNYPQEHIRHHDHQLFIASLGELDPDHWYTTAYDHWDKFRVIYPS